MADSATPQLDHGASTPLYSQVHAWLVGSIRRGVWVPGEPIPSERELSAKLGVSRATLRQAIEQLAQEGLLVRRQGRGTFVAEPKLEQPLDKLRGFSENMRELGVEPTSRLLEARLEPADAGVAAALEVETGTAVALIRRLRLADGVPLMVESCSLNYQHALGILELDLTGSLYELLENRYGLKLVFGSETLEVRAAEPWAARALKLPAGGQVLYTERVTADPKGAKIEFTKRYARPDRCRFRVSSGGADFTPI